MDFEIFEHTADQAIRAFGNSQKEVFINAAKALSVLSTEPEKINPILEFDIEISRENLDELLVAWLNELIFIQETEGVFLVEFDIIELELPILKAKVRGEQIDRERHILRSCLKAATYHCLQIEQNEEKWRCQVIFDV